MKIEQVAAQLYTVREFTKTPQDIADTLKKVSRIGYRAVQLSKMGPIAEEDLVRLCRENGLTICATHEPAEQILDDPESIVRRLQKLDCKYTAYPIPREIDFGSIQAVSEFIIRLNNAGRVLNEAGCVLTYHNHQREFRKINGKIILEKIYDETNELYVQGEIDVYWIQYGGGDPVKWCFRLKDRLPLLHLKDYRINAENQIEFAEVCAGTLDIKAIIAAAEASGCQWFIVEQDTCPGDRFDSLALSFNYIRDNLCE